MAPLPHPLFPGLPIHGLSPILLAAFACFRSEWAVDVESYVMHAFCIWGWGRHTYTPTPQWNVLFYSQFIICAQGEKLTFKLEMTVSCNFVQFRVSSIG